MKGGYALIDRDHFSDLESTDLDQELRGNEFGCAPVCRNSFAGGLLWHLRTANSFVSWPITGVVRFLTKEINLTLPRYVNA